MRRLIPTAVALVLAACSGAFPTTPVPANLPVIPAASVESWTASTRPAAHRLLRFHMTFNTDTPGRGMVYFAPTDSLYLHFAGPLGSSPGTAVVVGDAALWADPADKVQDFVPAYPLLWAMVGIARPPAKGWKVEGMQDVNRAIWRYVRGTDTVAYSWLKRTPAVLSVYVRLDNKPIGRVTTLIDQTGQPIKSRLDVLSNPARLEIVFDKDVKQTPFDRDLWVAPRP